MRKRDTKALLRAVTDMFVENHKGIIECTQKRIRFQTSAGIVIVTGEGLELKHLGAERIAIHGGIDAVEFQ